MSTISTRSQSVNFAGRNSIASATRPSNHLYRDKKKKKRKKERKKEKKNERKKEKKKEKIKERKRKKEKKT